MNDSENNIVHTADLLHLQLWLPWSVSAMCIGLVVLYARKWRQAQIVAQHVARRGWGP